MKMILGEYGKIIVLSMILCGFLMFLFSKKEGGYMGLISAAKPGQTVGQKDTFTLAESILTRKSPVLSVSVMKLRRGQELNLLDERLLQIKAWNEEQEKVSLSVVKITDPKQRDITSETDPQHFIPSVSGAYHMVYLAEEMFCGSRKTTEKEYCFLVD